MTQRDQAISGLTEGTRLYIDAALVSMLPQQKATMMGATQRARLHSSEPVTQPRPADAPWDAATLRHLHRERYYGIGYGNSSGHGSERNFTDGHADPLFHLG